MVPIGFFAVSLLLSGVGLVVAYVTALSTLRTNEPLDMGTKHTASTRNIQNFQSTVSRP